MNYTSATAWASVSRLFRFLFWYAVAVGGSFYLLPLVGLLLQSGYEALDGWVRLLTVVGLFAVVAVWQALAARDRWRRTKEVAKVS
jgi:hypothetical protein